MYRFFFKFNPWLFPPSRGKTSEAARLACRWFAVLIMIPWNNTLFPTMMRQFSTNGLICFSCLLVLQMAFVVFGEFSGIIAKRSHTFM